MTSANAGGNGQAPTEPAAPAGGNGQAPTTAQANNTGTPSAGQNGQAPTAIETYTPPSADEYKRLVQERDEARRDAGKYRTDLQKVTDAQLTEQQKLQRDYEATQAALTAAQRKVTELELSRAIERKAAALNIINPDVAARLLDWSEVEFDASGAPKNLEKLLTALIEAEPYLVANSQPLGQQSPQVRPASSGGATNPGAGGVAPGAGAGSGAAITAASYRAMSPQERIARNKEVQDTLRRFGGRLPD